MVGRVRKHLRFQREGVALAVDLAGLATAGAVEEVARVELQPGLRRYQREHPPAVRIGHARDHPRLVGLHAVDHPVQVVAVSAQQLWLLAIADVLADRFALAEIEVGPGDGAELAGGDQCRVDGRELFGRNGQHVVHHAAGAFAAEIPVGVVAQVDNGRLVGGGAVVDGQRVVVTQGVGRLHRELARIALVAIRADLAQRHARAGPLLTLVMVHSTLSKPLVPPCSEFGPSFSGT